jgi:hypothetical protein
MLITRALVMTKPLGCPFCGVEPTIEPWHGGGRKRMVVCENTTCHVGPQVSGGTRAVAIARWNQRATTGEAEGAGGRGLR